MSTPAKPSPTLKPDDNFIPGGLPGGFFVYEAEGAEEIYFAEQNVIELFGCKNIAELKELTDNSFGGMVHPEDLERIQNDIQAQTFTSEKTHDYVRYRIVTKQGEIRYVEDFGHLIHGENGKKFFYVYIVDVNADEYYNRDANSFAEAEIMAMHQHTDKLTGLANMSAFYESVQAKLDDDEQRTGLFFLHFDILNFKMFNDNYGFERGDDLLCRMAYTLRKEFPNDDVARFSNDHFVVCTSASDAKERTMRIHDTMASILDNTRVEVKVGVYKLDEECREVGIACDHARLACNTVKRRYDTVFAVYDDNFYERLRLKQYVVETIDEAIEKEYIKVFYQPVIRVATGRICGYEALARWIDPKMGTLSPSQFIPTLEEYRLIHKLDLFMFRKVCADLHTLVTRGEPVEPVSVNLSQIDFEMCDIFDEAENMRKEYDLPTKLIDIEITESALNADFEHLQDEIKRFRNAGYHIWIDDFGSGYSSLNNLLNYDSDVLKLDLEFLRTYDKNPLAAELIRHIVEGAKELGVNPLQEGVETEEHLQLLRAIGCERAQGYYFAKPMAIDESRIATRAKGLEWE